MSKIIFVEHNVQKTKSLTVTVSKIFLRNTLKKLLFFNPEQVIGKTSVVVNWQTADENP